MKSFFFILLLTLGLTVTASVHAEKADAKQSTNIEADQMEYDDVKQVNTFTGNVRLTRGTLIMKGHKMVMRQDPAGYQYGTLYAAPGALAFFRQKRDGGPNLWVEGYAERMEQDGKTDVSKLFSKAKLKRLDGTKVTDEVDGEFISYDSKTEFYSVNNTSTGVSKPGAGRIKVVMQPRDDKKNKSKSKDGVKAMNQEIDKSN
jgi:lipopolysaccharide export system protein LptA